MGWKGRMEEGSFVPYSFSLYIRQLLFAALYGHRIHHSTAQACLPFHLAQLPSRGAAPRWRSTWQAHVWTADDTRCRCLLRNKDVGLTTVRCIFFPDESCAHLIFEFVNCIYLKKKPYDERKNRVFSGEDTRHFDSVWWCDGVSVAVGRGQGSDQSWVLYSCCCLSYLMPASTFLSLAMSMMAQGQRHGGVASRTPASRLAWAPLVGNLGSASCSRHAPNTQRRGIASILSHLRLPVFLTFDSDTACLPKREKLWSKFETSPQNDPDLIFFNYLTIFMAPTQGAVWSHCMVP